MGGILGGGDARESSLGDLDIDGGSIRGAREEAHILHNDHGLSLRPQDGIPSELVPDCAPGRPVARVHEDNSSLKG